MARALTTKAVEAAQPSDDRREIPDGSMPGLYLVIQPSGAKSWAVRYRAQGKPRKLTIGRYPTFGLADARKAAGEALRAVEEGRDPASEKTQAKSATKVDADLIENVFAEFVERHVRKVNRSAPEVERVINRDLLPVWRGKRVQDITRRHVIDLLDKKVDAGAPIMANRILATVRKFYNWCISRGIVEASPCAGIVAPAAPVSRDRILSDSELAAVWGAASKLGYPFGTMVHLLILTGQRRSEVAGMRRQELRLGDEKPEWIIPAERAKNGKAHAVPLSPAVVDILKSLPRISNPGDYVFTTTGTTSVSGFSKAKAMLDAEISAEMGGEDLARWTFHDLRRTAASGMARLGINLPVIEKILNHISGSFAGIVGVYQRHEFAEEKRRALDAWSRFVLDLVNDKPAANVVSIREAAK